MTALSVADVVKKVALSRTTIWRLCRAGDFPKPVRLSPGRVGWLEAEIDRWLAARVGAR